MAATVFSYLFLLKHIRLPRGRWPMSTALSLCGSIPILADLQRILGIDPLLMGFGLERDTIHSPNESYLLSQLFRGMEAISLFYKYYRN